MESSETDGRIILKWIMKKYGTDNEWKFFEQYNDPKPDDSNTHYHAPPILILKSTFFWNVMLNSLVDNTNVSEEPVSIFRAEE
jgi:hypothetical protein